MFATRSAYEKHKRRAADRSRRMSEAGREIGQLPPVENPRRKTRCARNLRKFCEAYLPDQFPLAWAPFHLAALDELQAIILHGGSHAYALPRGTGKTTMAKAAALWAVIYGHRRYPIIVASTGREAAKCLKSLKKMIETSATLAADFPEVCYPIQQLKGLSQKAPGQLYQGQPTALQWKADSITFATIPGSLAAEATIETCGITGTIRGRQVTTAGGEVRRPDLVLIDDPQTRKSARSAAGSQARLETIQSDILGSAGPGQTIAAMACVTVIYPGDLADQLLDRTKHPEWRGTRAGILTAFPANQELVNRYAENYRADLAAGRRHHPAATRFWRANRAELEKDIRATWPARYKRGAECSAVQHAINLWIDNPAGWWSEYQNDPQTGQASLTTASRAQLEAATNAHGRGIVPPEATLLTSFIDVHLRALYWIVAAWKSDLTGYVLDYGTWPEQRRAYFTMAGCPQTIAQAYPGLAEPAQIRKALDDLSTKILTATYQTETGDELAVEVCGADTGWNYDIVTAAARQSPHRPRLIGCKGAPVGPHKRPMQEWRREDGDKLGPGWIYTRPSKRQHRLLQIDTNYNKASLHRGLARSPHEPGSVSLFAPAPGTDHQLFFDHLDSETATETYGHGRTVHVFTQKPDRPDNHWLDCLSNCLALASYRGATAAAPKSTRKKVGYLDL